MPDAADEFRDFVAVFAEPLTRLAALLAAASPTDAASVEVAERLAIRALARTSREWRDASSAPEQHAIDALLSRLPSTAPSELVVDFPEDEPEAGAIKSAVWRSWRTLDLRHRVPLLFADPAVASRRLDGIDVPTSFASARKLHQLTDEADRRFRLAIAQDDVTAARVDDAIEHWFAPTLADVAARFDAPTDVRARVDAETGRLRWRTGTAVAAIVVLLAGAVVVAVDASQPKRPSAAATAASLTVAPSTARTPAHSSDRVVDWPTRGNLSGDSEFLAGVRSAFVAAHPDALGQVQVLLAADTSWIRLAYVTSPSPDGAIGAWFYGLHGATSLVEGNFGYGAEVADGGVIAAAVSDPTGHITLVVIAPPQTTEVQWADVESATAPDPPRGVNDVGTTDGIAVLDVSGTYLPVVRLVVRVGDAEPWSGSVPEVQLANGSVRRIPIERGFADSTVLAAAMATARIWQRTGAFGSTAEARVVWGGTDEIGDVGVVLRMASPQLSDLVVVSWSSDSERTSQSRAYRIDAASSDTPFAFFYAARDGTRVGVLAPPGVASAGLVVDGKVSSPELVGSTGFASMPVKGQTGLLAEQAIAVQFFESSGRPIAQQVVPVQPIAGGGDD